VPGAQRPPEPKPAASPAIRRSVAVLLLRSSANPLALQRALAGFGGSMAFQEGGRSAGVFDPDVGENPVQRARQAAESLLTQGLVQSALVDVATVTVQRRAGGPPRYLGSVFARRERWPGEADPALLFTSAAVEALPELPCQPVPGREGLFQRPPTASAREDVTILQMGSGVLVGRELQLEDLLAGARSALEGRSPTLATVLGERGRGKTHLCAELVLRLRQELPQAQVYAWRAREPVQGDPEGTLRVLLRDSLNAFAAGDTRTEDEGRSTFFNLLGLRLGSELWPGVAATLGWLQPGAEGLQSRAAAPGALRSLAMRAAGEVLAAGARRRPLCILLDDAHHAEETALDALEYAALAESGLPLWVCVLARPGFARTRPAWGSRAAHRHKLSLEPLELEAAVELCRQVLRPAENVPVEALERLAERAQRVPLFLVELVRGLKRLGLVRQRPGGSWYLATDELGRMPELRVVEWLADRELGALPAELASHARLCALLGTEFSAAEAEGVLHELEREGHAAEFPLDARHATRRLLDLSLLVAHRHESLSFRNELVRETVVCSLPEPERLRIHRAAYRYFMSGRATQGRLRLPRLAFHAAAAGLSEEAAALYIDLAESARGRHAYLEAESTYSRALELLPEGDGLRRFTVLRGRGLMRYRVGRYEDSLADFAQARALARQQGSVAEEVDLLLDEAMALDWTNDYAHSEERALQAQDLARAHGLDSPLLEARRLLALGRSQFRRSQWHEARATLEAAATRAHALGDAGYESLMAAQLMLAVILPNLGCIDEAGRLLESAIAACLERGDRIHLGAAINNRRNLWVARHELQSALRDQRHFMKMGRELGMVGWEYFAEHNLGELHYQTGDVEAALPHIARAVELEQRFPEVVSQPWGMLLQARALAFMGERARAREVLEGLSLQLEARGSGVDMGPSGEVLRSMVELSTRESTAEEWQALRERSEVHSVEQEPLEVLELSALAALERGQVQQARGLLEVALERAQRIPNLMQGRLRRSLERVLRAG
jgi:eukaryotic-like serine/threonine-protein kinase